MAKSDETPKSAASSTQGRREDWYDAWIGKLVTDPGSIPDVTVVTGFVGPAAEDGAVRVYLDPQLQQCMEIPVDAIVHREEIPKTSSLLGGSHLWVLRNAMSRCKSFMRQN
jgi:hypothetical protein